MKRFIKKLRRRHQLDRDLEDEFRFHLEMKSEETGDASQARRQFGNLSLQRERCREMWTLAPLEMWWQDLRYAVRALRSSPGVTLAASVALTLGIGVNTAVFTIVSGALNFDPGIEHPENIIVISPAPRGQNLNFSDIQSQVKSLAVLAAYRFGQVNLTGTGSLPERYVCVRMSANGFSLAGRRPLLGRFFQQDDERPDAPPVLLLSYKVWRDRYGADPSIIGRKVNVDEVPGVVVGVMPPGMRFPEDTDLWTPLPSSDASNENPMMFGRLAEGVQIGAARSELDAIARRMMDTNPEKFKGLVVNVRPILEIYGVYDSRPLFFTVLCAVGLVLLIACANVANLRLGRAAVRGREISIRIAIGAGRARIIRQLLVESVALSLAGGFLGWLLALAGLHWFDISTARFPRPAWIDLSMNVGAFAYLAGISIGSGLLFGLAPALRLAQVDVHRSIKSGGHGAAGGTFGRRLSSLLVVCETALCVMLMAGAGLMIRSAISLYGTSIGVNTSNVLTARIGLPEAKYPRPSDITSCHERLSVRLESLPGTDSVALASNLPGGGWMDYPVELDGMSLAGSDRPLRVGSIVIGPEYFSVMQVKPRRGRLFTAADVDSVLVNETFAMQFWPGEDPLGKHVRLLKQSKPQQWLTVVGVIPDIQQNFRQTLESNPLMYLPFAQEPQRTTYIVSRTQVPPSTLVKAFRQEVALMDQNLPVYDVRTLEDRIALNRLDVGMFGTLFTVFGAIALILASVGLHAVVSHSVSQRTREIGIRMAAGGTARDIVGLVFAQGMRQTLIGLGLGLLAALAVTRVLRATLVGVSPHDPLTFLSVVSVLILAAALGCVAPARRAVRVDPVVALRCD